MRVLALIFFIFASILCKAHEDGNFVAKDLRATMAEGDKAALLLVHFGTTYADTRAVTIDAINEKVRATFPDMELREAYTSRIIIRRLKARGIEKQNPLEAMLRLRSEGYTHLVVQSTNVIDGVEMESLRRDVASVRAFFKEIRIGTPLLYSVEDAEAVVDIVGNRLKASASPKTAFVLVGHGTYTPNTSMYSQIDHMLKVRGYTDFHVGTVEGYPTYETVLTLLKSSRVKQVTLVPFMFVAGDHAQNDIATDWREELEKEGYKVDVRMEGLGQIPEIQDIFIEHIRFALGHRLVDIMEKKAKYAADKD